MKGKNELVCEITTSMKAADVTVHPAIVFDIVNRRQTTGDDIQYELDVRACRLREQLLKIHIEKEKR